MASTTSAAAFAEADLHDVVEKLTMDEATELISGVGFWYTAAIPRLGIPSIKVSDGPNGVRGGLFFNGTPANCIPCATALGATWDPALIEEVACKLLAPETKQRASSVLLAPTCNIQRSPLGGRSFESFAEDPHLSGMMASAYINGLQSQGVAACIKHFVANDQENERMGVDSIVSDRALREIYLYPFMLAQKNAHPMCYMTSYNKLNGVHCSENPKLLKEILRGEWQSNATVMSDWFGVYSVTESINASLDLEMPGTDRWRTTDKVGRSIRAYKTSLRTVKERAYKVLELVQKLCKTNAEVIDGGDHETYSRKEEDSALMRKVASNAIVLLKNEGGVLPLKPDLIKKLAIIGPNAKAVVASGGGSAAMKNAYVVTPYEGLISALPKSIDISYHEGCAGYMLMPHLHTELKNEKGEPGWTVTFYDNDAQDQPCEKAKATLDVMESKIFLVDAFNLGLTERFTAKFKGKLIPREKNCNFTFGLAVLGRGKLYVDGELVIDNWTRQTRGETFFGNGTPEKTGQCDLEAGKAHEIEVVFQNIRGPADGDELETTVLLGPGLQVGGAETLIPEKAVEEAVAIAKDADAVVLVIGLNGDWETEGYDRSHMDLPGLTDELVAKVAAVNKNTVVVCQSGSAVTMPWVDSVPALVQSWYGGNENGNAIADVLLGHINPSGKMPMTFPKRLQDVPSFGHFGSENGRVRYGEDLYVGYKSYEARNLAPLFPFGHGLSYTTFTIDQISLLSVQSSGTESQVSVSVSVTNTGEVIGSEVVQVYVSLPKGHLTHPLSQLRGFKKVHDIKAGATAKAEIVLDKYAFSYWDDIISKWRADKGEYKVMVGGSSHEKTQEACFKLEKAFEWSGL